MAIVTSSRDPVPGTCRPAERPSWQQAVKAAVRDPHALCRMLSLPLEIADDAGAVGPFGLFAPREYIARMRPGDPRDPLLRQVLPVAEEHTGSAGFVDDPVADAQAELAGGLLQKYHGRCLLMVAGACAVHCRYCFRRHYPYDTLPRGLDAFEAALEQIAGDDRLHEVIFSGGDPLMLADAQLGELTRRLARITHVRRLRVHTRLPIVIPQRVVRELLDWLRGTRLAPVVVLHANHPNEIDTAVAVAVERLVDAGVPVLNQAVLLRGVNDDADVLEALCERLVEVRVMPYYLHQLDRVRGAAHFEVPIERGANIVAQLRARLPGFAVPRYVRETPGAAAKTVLA